MGSGNTKIVRPNAASAEPGVDHAIAPRMEQGRESSSNMLSIYTKASTTEELNRLKAELSSLSEQLDRVNTEKSELMTGRMKDAQENQRLLQEMASTGEELNRLKAETSSLSEQLDRVNTEKSEWEARRIKDAQENQRLLQEMASTGEELNRLKAETSGLNEQLVRVNTEKSEWEARRMKDSHRFQHDSSSNTEQMNHGDGLQELGDLFDRLDQKKSGAIPPNVVFKGMISAGRSEVEALQVSEMVEVDLEGMVTKDAFIRCLSDQPGPFTVDQDDRIVTSKLFRELDTDNNGTISLRELEVALERLKDEPYKELAKALGDVANNLRQVGEGGNTGGDGLTFKAFNDLVSTLPRVRGERVQWARSLGLDGELARLLVPGKIFDGLSSIAQMSEKQQREVCEKFSRLLPIILRNGLRKLGDGIQARGLNSEAVEANSKFCGTAGAFHGKFATLKEFYQGPEGLIGQPNPNLMEGMQREHCKRQSSSRFFVTSNYLLRTTAEWEWFWVQNPSVESLPKELQRRLKNHKYPGEVGDVLKECEIHLALLKENFDNSALKMCKEDLRARLSKLLEGITQNSPELFITDEGIASASKANEAALQIRIADINGLTDAKRTDILGALAKHGLLPGTLDASGSDSELKIHLKMPKIEMAKSLQEKLVSVLGTQFDEIQCLKGARIVPRHPEEGDNGRIVLVIAIPCSELKSSAIVRDALSELNLGEIRLDIKAKVYEYCASAKGATKLQKQGRNRRGTFAEFFASDPISERQSILESKNLHKLIEAEVIALCLYTGPMFVLYNAVLRRFPLSITDLLCDENGDMNRFETTIFVICSGISKLSRLTDVPPNRLLYRGLGGMLLPDEFWKESNEGFKGGVEYGLMSTTTKRGVAIEYSGIKHNRGILLEIQAGRIDIGASISFLSQYPGEEEYLMQPLSCMEVIGQPRLEGSSHGEILVFPLRINVNLKSLTVEDLTQRRKVLHLSMAKNLGEEISIAASALIENFQAMEQRRAQGIFLEPIFGKESQVTITEEGSVKFGEGKHGSYAVVGAPLLWVSREKVCFEIEVKDASGRFSVGLAGTNFQYKYELGSDMKSWAIYNDGNYHHNKGLPRGRVAFGEDIVAGTILGLALDLEKGTLRVLLNGLEQECSENFSIKPNPAAGSALYPIISGRGGCELVLNSGRNGFRHAPPFPEYVALSATCRSRFPQEGPTDVDSGNADAHARFRTSGNDTAFDFLRTQRLSKDAICATFEKAIGVHKAIMADEFNDDDKYKQMLNEALDLKVCLLAKLETVIMLRKEGALWEQLKVCAVADPADFHGKRLQDECPDFLWRSIFPRCFLTERVTIPLTLPACQACLIWEGVLASAAVKKVVMGGNAREDEVFALDSLLPSLNLLSYKLHNSKYGSAVLGLLLASNSKALTGGNDGRFVREVNLIGIEFSPACTTQVVQAIAVGHIGGWMTRLNELSLDDSEALNLKDAVRRADKPMGLGLGKELKDMAEWAFVLQAVHARAWSKVNLSGNEVVGVCLEWVMKGVERCWRLECLDLSRNMLKDEGAKMVGAGLRGMSSLKKLELRACGFTAEGTHALMAGLGELRSMQHIDLGENYIKDVGATAVGHGLGGMSSLQTLMMQSCYVSAEGAKAITSGLSRLPSIQCVNLGGNELGDEGAIVLGAGLGKMTSLQILELLSCGMRSTGAKAVVAGLAGLSSMITLNLGGNKLGDEGALAVGAGLGRMPSLLTLELQSCGITATGAKALGQVLGARVVSSLQSVNLGPELGTWPLDTQKILLHAKADICGRNEFDRAPIHYAAMKGNLEVVRALMEGKADVLAKEKYGTSPIHRAAESGHWETLRALIDGKADVLVNNDSGEAPIHLAASNGHVEALRTLLEHKADVLAKDKEGRAPIHDASCRRQVKTLRMLMEAKADVHVKDNKGRTPLGWTISPECIEVLRGAGAGGWTPIHIAAMNGRVEEVRALQADVKAKTNDRWSVVHAAAEYGRTEVLSDLFKRKAGFHLHGKNNRGWAPIHNAASQGHVEAIRALMEGKAEVSSKAKSGCHPIHVAVKKKQLEAVRALIEFKADVLAKNNRGSAPIHIAALDGPVEAVRALIEGKADLLAKDNRGNAPIHIAVSYDKVEAVRALIEGKADLLAKDNRKRTPLDLALEDCGDDERNDNECVKALRSAGGA